MNFPATKLSAMLYSCWKMMLPKSGKQKRQSTETGFPTVRFWFTVIPSFLKCALFGGARRIIAHARTGEVNAFVKLTVKMELMY